MDVRKAENYYRILLLLVALACAGLCYLFVFRHTPQRTTDTAQLADTAFRPELHLEEVRADSFDAAITTAYKDGVQKQKSGDRWQYTITRGANTPRFYNANPRLLHVVSDDFKLTGNRSGDQVQASFKAYKKNGIIYLKVPADILFGLAQEF